MSEDGIRRVSNGQFALHWVRGGIVVLLLALAPIEVQYFIVVVAVALSYLEIYPRRTLRLFGREHEIDDDTRDARLTRVATAGRYNSPKFFHPPSPQSSPASGRGSKKCAAILF